MGAEQVEVSTWREWGELGLQVHIRTPRILQGEGQEREKRGCLCGVTAGHTDLGGWGRSKVTGVFLLTVECLVTVMVGMGELAALPLTVPGI